MCCHTYVHPTVEQMPQLTVAHSTEDPIRQSEYREKPGAAPMGKHLLTVGGSRDFTRVSLFFFFSIKLSFFLLSVMCT